MNRPTTSTSSSTSNGGGSANNANSNIPTTENDSNTSVLASSSKVTVTSVDIAMEPLTLPLTHAKCMKLRNQYNRLDANSQSIDRYKLTRAVDDSLTVEFLIRNLWSETDEIHWNNWDDETFFKKLLICFPADNLVAAEDPVDRMLELLRKYSIPNLADLSEDGRRIFTNRILEHVTAAFGGVGSDTYKAISPESQAVFVKQALQTLVEVNKGEPHSITAKRVRAELEQTRPADIVDYTVKLGRILARLTASRRELRDYGITNGTVKTPREHSGGDQPRSDKPNKSPRTENNGETQKPRRLCDGCGRPHGGDCSLQDHPNYNRSSNTWASTLQGIAFAAKGFTTLPKYKKLDKSNDLVPHVPGDDKKCKCNTCDTILRINYTYDKQLTNTDTVNAYIHTPSGDIREIETLIDSGALSHSYLEASVADELMAAGMIYGADERTTICGAIGTSCTSSLGVLSGDVMLYNEVVHKYDTFKIKLKIVPNLPFEMILGKPDIKTYDLSRVLRSQFANTSVKRPPPPAHITSTSSHLGRNLICDKGAHTNESISHMRVVDEEDDQRITLEGERCHGQNSDATPGIRRHSEPVVSAADLATTYHEYGDYVERTEHINMIKPLKDLIGVEDDRDELSKEMALDPKYAVPEGIYTHADGAKMKELIESIHTEHFKERHLRLYQKYEDLFSTVVRPEPADVPPMTLEVDMDKFRNAKSRQPVRKQNVDKEKEIERQVRQMSDLHVLERSTADCYSQVVLARKPNNKWRFCVDYKNLNECTRSPALPIPDIKQMINRIGEKRPKYMAVIDLTSGYHQAPLAFDSRIFTAFICFLGLFQWQRVPFGLKGAPGFFQQLMATIVLIGILYHFTEVYLDDVFVHGQTEDDYFDNLEDVFKRFRKHKLTIHPEKMKCGLTEVEYVGHTISETGIGHCRFRIDKVLQTEPPNTQGGLRSFVGVCEYFHDHIEHCADILRPLRDLVRS